LADIELVSLAKPRAPHHASGPPNAKSTVTSTGLGDGRARASAFRRGNLGTTALDLLDEGRSVTFMELSSFQLNY